MPRLPRNRRQELEEALAHALGRVCGSARRRTLEVLGMPPQLERMTQEVWDLLRGEFQQALGQPLEAVYIAALGIMAGEIGVILDVALANTWAAEWARQYGYELVTGINNTSRDMLREAVGAFYERPMSLGELRGRVGTIYSPVRAEMIAATEVTRAQSEGEQQYAAELQRQGVRTAPFWEGDGDECLLCADRVGKPITDGQYPPLHPRCDCWTRYQVVLEGEPLYAD